MGSLQEGDKQEKHTKDRKSGSAGMPRPTSYAVFCLEKTNKAPLTSPPFPAYEPQPIFFLAAGRSRRLGWARSLVIGAAPLPLTFVAHPSYSHTSLDPY